MFETLLYDLILKLTNSQLGSFGFLAGSTMEQQGLPNAGCVNDLDRLYCY